METWATPTNYSGRPDNEDLAAAREHAWTSYGLCNEAKGGAHLGGRARQVGDGGSPKNGRRGGEALRGNTGRLRDGVGAAGGSRKAGWRGATLRNPEAVGGRKED